MSAVGWVAVAGFALVLIWAGRRHRTALGGRKPGILALQLAGSGARLHPILESLGLYGRAAVRRALRIDTWIIVGYVGCLGALSLLTIGLVRGASDGRLELVGTVLAGAAAAAAVAAGGLDLVENRHLRTALSSWPASDERAQDAEERQADRRRLITQLDQPAQRASRAARAKFGLLGLVVLWLAAALTIWLTIELPT